MVASGSQGDESGRGRSRAYALTAGVLLASAFGAGCSNSSGTADKLDGGGGGAVSTGGAGSGGAGALGGGTGGMGGTGVASGTGGAGTAGSAGSAGAGMAGAGGAAGALTEVCLGFDIDVPSGAISGAMKIAGADGASAKPDFGKLLLRGAPKDEVPLGETWVGSYAVRAIAKTYDLTYAAVSAETSVPFNTAYDLSHPVTVGKGTATVVDVDVPMVTVSGTVTVGGRAAPTSISMGAVALRRDPAGDVIPLRLGSTGMFTARAIPGTYDVYYYGSEGTAGTDAPRNTNLKVKTGVTLAASGTTSLDIDIPSVSLGGKMSLAGVAGETAQDAGLLVLRSASGDEVEVGRVAQGRYDLHAAPGTYDLFYRSTFSKPLPPRNTNARVRSGIVVAPGGPHTLDLDVPWADVTGVVKLNGARISSQSDDVVLSLYNAETGDEVAVGPTTFGVFADRVVAGRYDVVYRGAVNGKASTLVPRNARATIKRDVLLEGSTPISLDLDVVSVPLSGTVAIDGVANAQSPGSFVLLGAAGKGDVVKLGMVSQGSYSLPVVPGTYDVVHDAGTNPSWTIRTGVVVNDGSGPLDIDMRTTPIHGSLTLNGEAIADPMDSGTLSLRDKNGVSIRLASTSAGTYSVRVPPGEYGVYYEVNTSGAHAPANKNARLGCLRVP